MDRVNVVAALLSLLASIATLVPLTAAFNNDKPNVVVYYDEWENKYGLPSATREYLDASSRVNWRARKAPIPQDLKDGVTTTYNQFLEKLRAGPQDSATFADDLKSWVALLLDSKGPEFYYPNGLTINLENHGDVAAKEITVSLPSPGWFETWSKRASLATEARTSQHTDGEIIIEEIAPGEGLILTFFYNEQDIFSDINPLIQVTVAGRKLAITERFVERQRGAYVVQLTLTMVLIASASVLFAVSVVFFVRWRLSKSRIAFINQGTDLR
jgi:hypothetical protein